jgi:hypothetical protein
LKFVFKISLPDATKSKVACLIGVSVVDVNEATGAEVERLEVEINNAEGGIKAMANRFVNYSNSVNS